MSKKEELEKLVLEYYQRLYSLEEVSSDRIRLPKEGFTNMSREEKVALSKPFTREEVVVAVKSMGKYKALGPDGFQPVFYQQCWETRLRGSVWIFLQQGCCQQERMMLL